MQFPGPYGSSFSQGYPPNTGMPPAGSFFQPPTYPPPSPYPNQNAVPPPFAGPYPPGPMIAPPRPLQPTISSQMAPPSPYPIQGARPPRRRALLIGINYLGSPNQLRGCINDVTNMRDFLVRVWKWPPENIIFMTDQQRDPRFFPSKANIIASMKWLVEDVRPGDSLFLHFSGHGSQRPDLDGDEVDGFDETILPADWKSTGEIVDDDMHAIMIRPLPPGVRFTALFDSCHSGTALDLPYIYTPRGTIEQVQPLGDPATTIVDMGLSLLFGRADRPLGRLGDVWGKGGSSRAQQRAIQTRSSPADAICFSSSRDEQLSADTTMGGQNAGALSYAFIQVLSARPHLSYLQLLNAMMDIVRSRGLPQTPTLSTSHPFDVNAVIMM